MSPKTSFPTDEILRQLETGRDGATRIMAGSKPFRGRYNRARDITQAIDELVEALTGDRERFWTKPLELPVRRPQHSLWSMAMADDETPAEWWVREMMEDADMDRVIELSSNILDCCDPEEHYQYSEVFAALGRVLALILMDAGRSGREAELVKKMGTALVVHWIDAIDELIKSKQH